jgi:heterotetrameric sarcosine oxidase gamma subunit
LSIRPENGCVDDNRPDEALKAAGLTVRADLSMHVATLRYFESGGAFARAVQAATGVPLPAVQRALEAEGGELTLAWRSPTETLLLSSSAGRLSQLEEALAHTGEGCLLNVTGGLTLLRVTGERIADLLCRLGGAACVPAVGEARRSRLADVPVLALAVREGEALLLVDRGYAAHLTAWIRETLLDFADA